MGTYGCFGILLEEERDIIYVRKTSCGSPECMGESMLSVLRNRGVEGLLIEMRDSDLERVDHLESQMLTVASDEGDYNEWTFSEWVYLYRQRTDSLLVCYPIHNLEDTVGDLYVGGKNPYGGQYWLTVLLEAPIKGTEIVMDIWERIRPLKRAGLYLTLYK